MVRWEIVERIGAYAAGELSGEEAREAERLIREAPEALELAESYTRLLDCLSAVGRDSPVPPPAIVDYAVWWAAHSCVNPTSRPPAKDVARAGQEDTRKVGRNNDD